jgi:hypothetical protein
LYTYDFAYISAITLNIIIHFLLFKFCLWPRVWTQALHLPGRSSTTWDMPLALFPFVIFPNRVLLLFYAYDPPIYASHVARMIGMQHCTQLFIVEMGSCELFYLFICLVVLRNEVSALHLLDRHSTTKSYP